ncbi:MAG: DUF1549 domain-containing protein [Planctomycetota bacterium]|nr:DUF1549 domain-containing protein [Planctomycetota bacterium]
MQSPSPRSNFPTASSLFGNWQRLGHLLLLSLPAILASRANSQEIDFAHDVVPILKRHCTGCHTNGTYKGGLSMDHRDSLLRSGVVKKGEPDKSELILRITSKDEDERMPQEGPRLSRKEIATLEKWIAGGVSWETGFTFRKQTWRAPILPRKPEIPAKAGHPVDYLVGSYLKQRNQTWPDPIDDALFLRKVSLDLVGLLPSAELESAFLADQSPDRRLNLVRKVLANQRNYADHWLTFWNDHLRNDYVGTGYIDGGRKQITGWLYRSLFDNKPYNEFASELIAPTAESEGFIRGIKWRGNVNASQVRELQFAQSVAQVFLGENLKCASCHDSFINDWKLTDAYGMAAIIADKPLEMYRCDKPTGEIARIKFLWPELGDIEASGSRSERLKQTAHLITRKENGRFARTIVNRIWKKMMGRGLVEPVDVMGNRPWNEDLLDFLASDLVENGYDLKKTMERIASSRIYQSRSIPFREVPGDDFTFRGPMTRRLTAEQFLDGVWQLTGTVPKAKKGPIPDLQNQSPPTRSDAKAPASGWIWNRKDSQNAAGNESVTFEGKIEFPTRPESAWIVITCDNEYTLFVNKRKIRNDSNWNTVELLDIRQWARKGSNEIRIIAKNHTEAANPAGLYMSCFADGESVPLMLEVREGKKVRSAERVDHPEIWTTARKEIVGQENRARKNRAPIRLRAGLVVSDSLMRSLGRPNREQIVTTRDDQLSTLQALDLSNGETFANILKAGAGRLLAQSPEPAPLIRSLFSQGLSRKPTREEFRILKNILTDQPTQETVADLLWTIVMLPEFQHVR